MSRPFSFFKLNRPSISKGGLGLVTLVAICSLLFFLHIDKRGGSSVWNVLPSSKGNLYSTPTSSSPLTLSSNQRILEKSRKTVLSLPDGVGSRNEDWESIETKYLNESSIHGFSMFERLYLYKGTLYIATSGNHLVDFPPLRQVIAKPLELGMGHDLEPTSKEMTIIHPRVMQQRFGQHALWIHDTSILIYDPPQFLNHYYHYWGEIIIGIWRMLSAWATHYDEGRPVTPPARFILPWTNTSSWGDHANVNSPLMRMAFPGMSMEKASYWKDLENLNMPVVFERVMIINRETAHRHPWANQWNKMIGPTMSIDVPKYYFEALRQRIVTNVLGYLPAALTEVPQDSAISSEHEPTDNIRLPLVLYISRQGGGRRLTDESHNSLVQALRELEQEGLCNFVIAQMERMRLPDQIELAAKSAIVVGVHGNGLTHVIWMPPSNRSTVIEILQPPSYVFDYEILARNMGHKHYAVWNDTTVTYPPGELHPTITYVEGFNGEAIPVHGPAVAQVVRERLTMDIVEGM